MLIFRVIEQQSFDSTRDGAVSAALSTIPKTNYQMRINPPAVIQQSCEALMRNCLTHSHSKVKLNSVWTDLLAVDNKANHEWVIQQLNLCQSECEDFFSLYCQTVTYLLHYITDSCHQHLSHWKLLDCTSTQFRAKQKFKTLFPGSAQAQYILTFANIHQSETQCDWNTAGSCNEH